jgi:ferredoxin-NADP reductase
VARAAVLGRLTWRVASVVEVRAETATARTLLLDVSGWPGHLPGQHVDVRLTADDGYSTQRSYSIASAPGQSTVDLTVEAVEEGEVSPYLTDVVGPGDEFELRGPIGGWFVWRSDDPAPVLLVAGGSGIVPLMAMIRTRAATGATAPFRLVYSVRTPESAIYEDELRRLAADGAVDVTFVHTRRSPAGSARPPGRLDAALLESAAWPAADAPAVFVCGPTGFVEAAATLLVAAGHDPARIKTERFGPTGGAR